MPFEVCGRFVTGSPIKPWANSLEQVDSHCQQPGRFEVHSSCPTAGKLKWFCLAFIDYISYINLLKSVYPNTASAGTSTFLKRVNTLTESEHISVETLLRIFICLFGKSTLIPVSLLRSMKVSKV